jgi:hypothetical protein
MWMAARLGALAVLAVLLSGCGGSEPAAAPVQKAAAVDKPKLKDHRAGLALENQVSTRMVEDHILESPKLPGGSFGEYEKKGKKYQMFIVESASAQEAALILFSYKATLQSPEYIAYMGGYFGSDGKQSVYVFSKKEYVAGIVGLSMAEADPMARSLAGRLH